MVNFGLSFFPSLFLAILGAILLSFSISVPSLRLKGDYFVLASLGFQVIFFTTIYNWIDVTQGPYGISGIPRPSVLGFRVESISSYFVFAGLSAAICGAVIYLIAESPFGRVLKAIREDDISAAALGKNVPLYKISAFAVSAGFAAVAGALFAGYMRFIDPTSFSVMESIFILSILIIGGTGNFIGPILGTVLLVILPEMLRFLSIPDTIAPNLRQIIYGLLIILIMRLKPQGLSGVYRFE
jgi:branched-chain amino acid transport system permease protein